MISNICRNICLRCEQHGHAVILDVKHCLRRQKLKQANPNPASANVDGSGIVEASTANCKGFERFETQLEPSLDLS